MFSGTVTLRAEFPKVEFEQFEITCHQPLVTKATISSSPANGLVLEVDVSGADSVDTALATARACSLSASKMLTFHFGTFVSSFNLVEHALVEEVPSADAGTTPLHHLGSSIGFFMNADVWNALNAQKITEVQQFLAQSSYPGFLHYDLFRSALGMDDALSKFMALYNIVLYLCNDSQEDVDTFVLSIEPGIATNAPFRPRRSGVQETIYTRLRNQVGHVRPGTTIEGTRNEMAANLEGLIKATKEIINRQP